MARVPQIHNMMRVHHAHVIREHHDFSAVGIPVEVPLRGLLSASSSASRKLGMLRKTENK
eukprot:4368573-Pleurochrysis_carterae.AAC.1